MNGQNNLSEGAQPRASLFGRARKAAPSGDAPPPSKDPKKPRRSLLSVFSGLLTFVLIGALIAVGAVAWLMMEARKPGPLAETKIVNIVREDDGGSIAEQLEHAGVIDSASLFNILTLLDGKRSAFKRGEYEFRAGISVNEIESLLASHRVVQYKVTIPEGLTSEQVVERLRAADALSGDVKEIPREGSLAPDTYRFERGYSRQALLQHMEKAQEQRVDEIWKTRSSDLPIRSPGEMVTLASIVEKETGKPDERPRVAGVFINRLEKHMRLQSDPTIVYGLAFGKGTLGHSITKAELSQPTAYNTYLIDGLPPGPISNPGKASLEAVANPARSHDLYFVADGSGGHAFAETLDQHGRNVAHWRQIEKDAKDKLAPDAAPPSAMPAIRGAIDPVDPQSFGVLSAPAPQTAARAIVARLAKIGAGRKALDSALASITGESHEPKSLEDLGAVITGVNDAPQEGGDLFARSDSGQDPPGGLSSISSSPVPAAMLADQRAREAKYGNGAVTPALMASADPVPPTFATPSGRPSIRDASEGTKLDPLLNKTWDLSYAKEVPTDLAPQH